MFQLRALCWMLLSSLIISLVPIRVLAQSSTLELDLSKELSELTSAEAPSTKSTLDSDFDWSDDLAVMNDDLDQIAVSNKAKKIASIKSECKAAFAPEPISLLTISKPLPVSPINRARDDCHEKYIKPHWPGKLSEESINRNAQCVLRLTELYTKQGKEKANSSYKRRQAAKYRKKEKRAQTQKYCESIKSDLAAGKLPRGNFPQWTEIDEVKTIAASRDLQNEIDTVLTDADGLNERLLLEKRIQKNEDEAAFAAKIAEREAIRINSCRIKINAGQCPCGCFDMCTRPPPIVGVSQVCEK